MDRQEMKRIIRAAYLIMKGTDEKLNRLEWKFATGRLNIETEYEIMNYLGTNSMKETLGMFDRANRLVDGREDDIEKAAKDLRINKKKAQEIIKRIA